VKNKNYIISVSIFCMIAVVQFSYRLLMSLWVKASRDIGGLGWQIEEYPGYMNSGSGVFIALFPFFLTPYLSHKYGVKKSCLITIFFMIPVVFLISWCYLLYGIPMWICLILLNGLSNALSTVFINFISIAVSNSVSPNITGAALGICQSVTALCRSVATGTTGVLYGSNQGWGLSFPLDSHFMFILIDIILIINFIFILTNMKPELEKRKITDEEIPLINKNN
jgi:MFS family permease